MDCVMPSSAQRSRYSLAVYWQPWVRHEALSDRGRVKGPPLQDCRSSLLEAGGSLNLEAQARAASSPDNDGTDRHLQTARARQARRDGTRVQKPVVKPPQGQNRLEPGGHGPVSSARLAVARRLRSSLYGAGPGGHEE